MRRCLQSDPADSDGEEMDEPLAGMAKEMRPWFILTGRG